MGGYWYVGNGIYVCVSTCICDILYSKVFSEISSSNMKTIIALL